MQIGISLASSHQVDDVREGARRIIERAQTARRAELDTLTLGDHHARSTPYYQNTPMLGRLLTEWDGPSGCLFLAPLWNPVLMAEHIGTLASLSGHRFIVQVGVGDEVGQFGAMGADISTRGRRTEATVNAVSSLLSGATVTSPELGIDAAAISPIPPEPVEWWVGGGAPRSIDRAARLGDAWYCGPASTPDEAARLAEVYRRARAEHDLDEGRAIIRRDVVVRADGAAAERDARDLIDRGYRGFPQEAVISGDPRAVAEQFAAFRPEGFTEVVTRCMSVPQTIAVETIEALGEVRRLLNA